MRDRDTELVWLGKLSAFVTINTGIVWESSGRFRFISQENAVKINILSENNIYIGLSTNVSTNPIIREPVNIFYSYFGCESVIKFRLHSY